jgi:hypothetical protein
VEVVLAEPGWPLASRLMEEPGWEAVEKTKNIIIFQRLAGGHILRSGEAGNFVRAGTNGFPQSSRILLGRAPK